MPPKPRTGPNKGGKKHSAKSSTSRNSSSHKKTNTPKPTPTQHKPSPRTAALKQTKKKPPHLRYSEKELKVAQLNGIRPSGVQKLPNAKKGKKFVDDGEGMKMILAMVMAEKEGDVESRMMRARQLEEVREARKAEMEKRAVGKREGLEGRKEEIRKGKGRRRGGDARVQEHEQDQSGGEQVAKKVKKKVSFG